MKYIIIDDNIKFAERLLVELKDDGEVISSAGYVLNELANEIQVRAKNESDTVLLININLKAKNSSRQEQKGIELLKLLRLRNFNNHCIKYSFQSLTGIVKANPLNAILLSKGVSFVQLPSLFEGLNKTEKSERENLLPFFRAELDLKKIRHEEANYYALKQFQFWHNITTSNLSLKQVENDPSLINYVFKSENTNIDSSLINFAKSKIQYLGGAYKIILLDDMAEKGWSAFLKSVLPNSEIVSIPVVPDDDFESLFKKFETHANEATLFISDLRLFPYETEFHDYRYFQSVKVLEKIKTAKAKARKSKYFYIKTLLLTASNNLILYKSLISSEKNSLSIQPDAIVVKEGADLYLNSEQSFENYLSLLSYLDLLLNEKYYKENLDIEFISYQDVVSAINLKSQLSKMPTNTIDLTYVLKNVSHILIDTNMFLEPRETIRNAQIIVAILETIPEKVVLLNEVYLELVNWSNKKILTNQQVLAQFYINKFNELKIVFDIPDSHQHAKKVKDFADAPLVEKAKYLSNLNSNNILFLSDDWKKDGPCTILKKYIQSRNIKNVKILPKGTTVESFFSDLAFFKNPMPLKEIKNDLPSIEKGGNKNIFKPSKKELKSPKTNKIVNVKLSNSKISYIFILDNTEKVIIPKENFLNFSVLDIVEKFHGMSISYSNEMDFINQVISSVKSSQVN